MNTSVRSYIPKLITSADVTQGLAKAVAGAVQAPVTAAAAQAFRELVVPAVEGGCQEMFRQVNVQLKDVAAQSAAVAAASGAGSAEIEGAVKRAVADGYREQQSGIATLLAENQRATLQQLQSHEEYMTNVVKTARIGGGAGADGDGDGGGDGDSGSQLGSAAASGPVKPSADEQIDIAIAQGNYQDAFSKALGAQDLGQ